MAGKEGESQAEIWFGRTALTVAVGELVDQPVEAIITAGNQRAMFSAGAAGTLWTAAGEDVERELRSHAPLEIGSAVATGAGRLSEHGTTTIVHAIVAAGLGERPRQLAVPRALEAAFDQAVARKVRSLAMPLIGAPETASADVRIERAEQILETLIAVLRTRSHRIDRGILVTRFEDDRNPLTAAISRARERLWTR
jgi:O-acetyl-ADP-ribose deacetylase (regulator of RNase III)